MVDDPEYQRGLLKRLKSGKLAPAVECMIWYYAKSKPADTLKVEDAPPVLVVDELTPEDIQKIRDERRAS
jgi:hypothetical protein